MTRLPVRPQISPEQGLLFVESIRDRFSVVALSEKEVYEVIAAATGQGVGGGKIYDAMSLRCAEKSKAEAVYTWDLDEFRQLAAEGTAERLWTP